MTELLKAHNLERWYAVRRGNGDFFTGSKAKYVKAVDGVSFAVSSGQTLGIVGESGCGKSTLGRVLLGLDTATGGDVTFNGSPISGFSKTQMLRFRRSAQMIFQDPMMSLNPRLSVGAALTEVLAVHNIVPPAQRQDKVVELLRTVGLTPAIASRLPRTLSGGQCQRIGIARALALDPDVVVADEAVSALDVSVQAQILNLFIELQRRRNMALVFISHDLEVVRHICDHVIVMYLGKIVESGPVADIFSNPQHPYTQALISSVPRINGPGLMNMEMLAGEPPSPTNRPDGCAFHPRCSKVMPHCKTGNFPATRTHGASQVACHLYGNTTN